MPRDNTRDRCRELGKNGVSSFFLLPSLSDWNWCRVAVAVPVKRLKNELTPFFPNSETPAAGLPINWKGTWTLWRPSLSPRTGRSSLPPRTTARFASGT